jgi:lysozyme family protein
MIPSLALGWVCIAEGVVSDVPGDRGGRTIGGIAHASDSLTFLDWAAKYHGSYWLPVRAPELPLRLALAVFDASVNSGPHTAITTLQRIVLTDQDGQFGPVTMAALDKMLALHGEQQVVTAYCDQRDLFYDAIVANDATQAVFLEGWHRRIAHLRVYLDFAQAIAA